MSEQSDAFWFGLACGVGAMVGYSYFFPPPAPLPPAPVYTPPPDNLAGETADGSVWRVALGSVRGPRSDRYVWVNQDHEKNKKIEARSTMALYSINCDTTGYQPKQQIDYDKGGNSIQTWNLEKLGVEPSFAAPGSMMDGIFQIACLPEYDPVKEKSQIVK